MSIQRQNLTEDNLSDDEVPEPDCQADDEKPVVVVLRPGDLTAEEAEEHTAREGHQEPGSFSSYCPYTNPASSCHMK